MDYQNNCAANPSEYAGRTYSDVYIRILPYIQSAVDSICEESLFYLSDEDVERLSDEVIQKSNAYEGMPAGHSRETVSDLTRALVLQGLLDRIRRRRSMPFFAPIFFYPIDDRDRSRDNDRNCARNRDRERDYDCSRDRLRDPDRDYDGGRDRLRDPDRDYDCHREHDCECFRERDRNRYPAGSRGRGWY